MAVYKRGNVWWYKFVWNGEPIRASTKHTNKRVAEQIEAARKTQLAKGEFGIEEKKPVPTLEAFAPRFLAQIRTDCATKPATVSFYERKLQALLQYGAFAKSRLDRIDEEMIDVFKQTRARTTSRRKRPLSVASINRELATLRRLLRLAQKWKIISAPTVKMLDGETEREFVLNHSLEMAYLDVAPPDLHDAAIVMLDTGLRVKECLTLEWPDVHPEPVGDATFGYLTVRSRSSKNSKPRNVPLSDRVMEVFERRRNGHAAGLVFHREDGRPLYQTWLNQQHVEVRKALGLPEELFPHSFRHIFGTRLGESCAYAYTIMKLMGHSSLKISQKYVHPSPEHVERAFQRMRRMNATGRRAVGT